MPRKKSWKKAQARRSVLQRDQVYLESASAHSTLQFLQDVSGTSLTGLLPQNEELHNENMGNDHNNMETEHSEVSQTLSDENSDIVLRNGSTTVDTTQTGSTTLSSTAHERLTNIDHSLTECYSNQPTRNTYKILKFLKRKTSLGRQRNEQTISTNRILDCSTTSNCTQTDDVIDTDHEKSHKEVTKEEQTNSVFENGQEELLDIRTHTETNMETIDTKQNLNHLPVDSDVGIVQDNADNFEIIDAKPDLNYNEEVTECNREQTNSVFDIGQVEVLNVWTLNTDNECNFETVDFKPDLHHLPVDREVTSVQHKVNSCETVDSKPDLHHLPVDREMTSVQHKVNSCGIVDIKPDLNHLPFVSNVMNIQNKTINFETDHNKPDETHLPFDKDVTCVQGSANSIEIVDTKPHLYHAPFDSNSTNEQDIGRIEDTKADGDEVKHINSVLDDSKKHYMERLDIKPDLHLLLDDSGSAEISQSNFHSEGLEMKEIRCKICCMVFNRVDDFDCHRIKCEGKTKIVSLCDRCWVAFPHQKLFNAHTCHSTMKENGYTCGFCMKVFKILGCFSNHLKTHIHKKQEKVSILLKIGSSKKEYTCETCQKIFFHRHHLTYHMRTHEPFRCRQCPAKFDKRFMLQKHQVLHRPNTGLWSDEELAELDEYFKEFLELTSDKRWPEMEDCLSGINKSMVSGGQLHRRHWKSIKKKVYSIMQRKRKSKK